MSVTRKPSSTGAGSDTRAYLGLAAVVALILAVVLVWIALMAGAALGHGAAAPRNPFAADSEIASGKVRWPGAWATVVLVAEVGALAWLLVAAVKAQRSKRATPKVAVDAAAPYLASREEQHLVSFEGACEANRLIDAPLDPPGSYLGEIVGTDLDAWGNWELAESDAWGTRRGKTSTRAIPAVISGPGPVLASSNKRDLVDCTRGIREKVGTVWVFDVLGIAGEPSSWWCNLLGYVTSVGRALRLAAVLTGYMRPPGASPDPYFEPEGENLLAFLLLAAAVDNRPITDVFLWATDPTEREPARLLKAAGYKLPAAAVENILNLPDKQRAGVYGTAKKTVNFLVDPEVTAWVTPDPEHPRRPVFDPDAFVAGRDTLYVLSREGASGAGALVTALVVMVLDAGELKANRTRLGRLKNPMTCVLDEVANAVRWKDLPDLYSHYGSKGIKLLSFFQSWAQGVYAFGEHGMTALWSAAPIRIYGGGNIDPRFLGDLGQLIGDYEPVTTSSNVQHGSGQSGHSVTTSTRVERILEVSDLAALPPQRAVLMANGMRPVLLRTRHWKHGPYAEQIMASIDKYAPSDEVEGYLAEADADPELEQGGAAG